MTTHTSADETGVLAAWAADSTRVDGCVSGLVALLLIRRLCRRFADARRAQAGPQPVRTDDGTTLGNGQMLMPGIAEPYRWNPGRHG